MIDNCTIVPISACVFALIVFPLLTFFDSPSQEAVLSGADARPENRIFWPVMAAISVLLAIKYRSRLAKLSWPPHIVCLFVCVGFAGASVLWAFRLESSFIRFVQQLMIVISIVLPTMLAARTSDLMRALFLSFAFASILNLLFVFDGTATIVINAGRHGSFRDYLGSPGYFSFKNYLGECAAVAFLLSLYEIRYRGVRRGLGIIVTLIAISLLFSSDSKTAFGLALVAPILAGLTLIAGRVTRISLAVILLSIPFCYVVLSSITHYNLNGLSYKLYGDATFTGRTIIWNFVQSEIGRRPLLGWGYESFWLVPGSPSGEAPGWVKMMPNAHNGYYDTMLQMGYLGLACLGIFITATLHAIGRVADRDPAKAWLVLSLALFIICYNFLETLWMHGFEFLWVVFVIVAAEIGRYWRPLPLTRATYGSRRRRPASPSPSRGAETPRPGISRMDAEKRGKPEPI
jgi:O-antigen ligase